MFGVASSETIYGQVERLLREKTRGARAGLRTLKNVPSNASDGMMRLVWPFVMGVFKNLARKTPGELESKARVTIVRGQSHTNRGPDLDRSLIKWSHDVWPQADSLHLRPKELANILPPNSLVLICYSWLQALRRKPRILRLLEVGKLAMLFNRKKCVVLGVIPDTYIIWNSLIMGLLIAATNGRILLQQNSQASAGKFGLEKSISPVFWTWPSENVQRWKNPTPLAERQKFVAFAVSGDPRRESLLKQLSVTLHRLGYEILETGDIPSYESYADVTKQARIFVTTCWLQERFIEGPSWYRNKLSNATITHRVWEAFASSSLLVCNSNSELESLGFVPGEHYVELPSANLVDGWQLPSGPQMEKIATAGHAHFLLRRTQSLRRLRGLVASRFEDV